MNLVLICCVSSLDLYGPLILTTAHMHNFCIFAKALSIVINLGKKIIAIVNELRPKSLKE